jgi:hypothetical protein
MERHNDSGAVATFFALAKPLLDGDVTVVMANEVFASR